MSDLGNLVHQQVLRNNDEHLASFRAKQFVGQVVELHLLSFWELFRAIFDLPAGTLEEDCFLYWMRSVFGDRNASWEQIGNVYARKVHPDAQKVPSGVPIRKEVLALQCGLAPATSWPKVVAFLAFSRGNRHHKNARPSYSQAVVASILYDTEGSLLPANNNELLSCEALFPLVLVRFWTLERIKAEIKAVPSRSS